MSKVSHKDLLNINAALVYLSQQDTDAWLKVSRNIKLVKPKMISWNESNKDIIDKYAEKDKEGELIVENDSYVFGKNREKADQDYEKLMEEKVSVAFIKIKGDELTKDGAPAGLNAINIEPLLDVVIE